MLEFILVIEHSLFLVILYNIYMEGDSVSDTLN